MTPEDIAKLVLNILSKQSFKDWYDTDFEAYVVGEKGAPSEPQILSELTRQISQEIR